MLIVLCGPYGGKGIHLLLKGMKGRLMSWSTSSLRLCLNGQMLWVLLLSFLFLICLTFVPSFLISFFSLLPFCMLPVCLVLFFSIYQFSMKFISYQKKKKKLDFVCDCLSHKQCDHKSCHIILGNHTLTTSIKQLAVIGLLIFLPAWLFIFYFYMYLRHLCLVDSSNH